MKKMLLLFAAGCTLLFTGCSKDDKDGGANLSLNETNISLHHEQTKQLKASDAVTWSSESNFVATVNASGLVEGNHVGKTHIVATKNSDNVKCVVEVTPMYSTFTEPLFDFGASVDQIKSKEKRSFQYAKDNGILFKGGKSSEVAVMYLFENSKMVCSAISISYLYAEEAIKFIAERYQPIVKKGYDYYFVNNDLDKSTMLIAISLDSLDDSMLIMYTEASAKGKALSDGGEMQYENYFREIMNSQMSDN